MLQPGPNRLAFQVTVLRQGLYSLKHVLARLGRLSLRLRVAAPEDEGPPVELLTAPPLTGVLSEAQALAQPAIGDVDVSGGSLLRTNARSCCRTFAKAHQPEMWAAASLSISGHRPLLTTPCLLASHWCLACISACTTFV